MAHGILYFLVNEAMPGLVKIGHTTGKLESRLQQLSSTSVPSHFRVVASFYVNDSRRCEKDVHTKLRQFRSNPKREFFVGSPALLIEEAISVIGPHLSSSEMASLPMAPLGYEPDEDDIYFMFFLLHDCYAEGGSYSSEELAEHHNAYDPVTLDVKLMDLEKHGFIKRVNKVHEGIGRWCIVPKGVKFMLDGNYHDLSLLNERRRGA